MDAPNLPSTFFCSGSQEEIAPIHSASWFGAWPWALMEYAGAPLWSTGRCLADAVVQSTGWVPTLEEIGELETKLQLPVGARPLKTFTREYAGIFEGGRQMIVGTYSASSDTVIIAKSMQDLHMVYDGGCGIVQVKYDLTRHKVIDAFCHGVA